MKVTSKALADTSRFGEKIGAMLRSGDVIALVGPLGVGKTALVSGIAKGMGIHQYAVTSPTFVFAHIYEGEIPLYHIDLYRVEKESELRNLGIEEMIGGAGVAAVEWLDRFPNLWEGDRLMIQMQFGNENGRILELSGKGKRFESMITNLENQP